MIRNAEAVWAGTGKEGKGNLTTQSAVLVNTPYSYTSRFENGIGTNPEELLAAAHAGCFTMKLAFVCGAAGFTPVFITTTCDITLEDGSITLSHLKVKASVKDITKEKFEECVADAKANCPVSKLYNTTISVESTLL